MEGTLIEETPTCKHWINKHLYYLEDRRHLKRSIRHRLPFYIDQMAVYFNYNISFLIRAEDKKYALQSISTALFN